MRPSGQGFRSARKVIHPREFVRHPLTALMLASGLLPGWSYANTITPDGHTDTNVAIAGAISDITTGTVRGKTGFNSFHDFKVSSGNTVNVHVPGSATHLVNLVHDSRAEINGTLNGLQNGKIGGNIIFADPHGFVVGSSGVVNVGTLTVTTPNSATMAEMLRLATQSGISDAETNAYVDLLAAGKLPAAALAADGSNAVVIEGMINTNGSINLHGASVLVGATAALQAGTDVAQTVFDSTVNTDGLSIGEDISRADGNIVIIGAEGVEISGELAALMADGSGASVQIGSSRSVTLKGDSQIITSGEAGLNSGDVVIEAPAITLSDNAQVITRASGAGQSGSITLNALSDISCTFCDETAEVSSLEDLKTGIQYQANPWLSANLGKAAIIVGENARLDAGHAVGERAGDITLDAFALNRQMAGYAKASATIDVDGTLIGRDVTLTADSRAEVSRDIIGMLLSKYDLKEDIAALAADNGWTEAETWGNVLDTLADPLSAYAGTADRDAFLATPTNFTEFTLLVPNLSAYIADADATVTIGSNAVLVAENDLGLWARSQRSVDSSTWKIPVLGAKIPFGFDAAYGQISGLTSVQVESGADLTVGRDLNVAAHSDNSLSVSSAAENSVDGNGNALKTMGLGFGMAMSDIDTRAIVADGVKLKVGQDVNVVALTEQSLENNVSFKASGEGATGGPAVGISLLNSKTRAEFSADLNGARNLNLSAANIVYKQTLSVSVAAGSVEPGYLDKLKAKAKEQVAKPVTDYLGESLKGFFGITPSEAEDTTTKPTDSKFRLASAVGVTLADHQVEAVLGSGNAAPNIDLSGDLTVQAWQDQQNLHNSVQSKVNASAKRDDGTTDGAAVSLSVAAVYTELDQKTHAIIGDGSHVSAGRIGLGARFEQPIGLSGLDRWSSLKTVFANLKQLSGGPLGLIPKVATQYANSTGEADKLGMAGSLSILQNRIDTAAWAGDNVSLTATAPTDAAWSSTLLDVMPTIDSTTLLEARRGALRGITWDWNAPISVHASNKLEQLAIAGNFDALFGTTSEKGGAVGAGLNIQILDNQAVAGIGANGTVTTQALRVSALQDELIIGLSPSAGKGASVAGNGSVVVSVVDGTVHASVHSSTDVNAGKVDIDAEHRLGLWSASGALASSENVGIGAGVAVNVVNTDVYALVGDNNVRTNGVSHWRPESMGAGLADATQGAWLVNDLSLSAQSSGQSGAFSVAGALARSEKEQAEQDQVAQQDGAADKGAQGKAGSLGEAIKTSLTNGLALITGEVDAAKTKASGTGDAAMAKLSGYWEKLQGVFSGGSGGDSGSGNPAKGFSLAAAASGSVNVSAQKNRAHLGNILLDPRNTITGGSRVSVLSLNQTHQFSGSGAGALTLAGGDKSKFSSALAGAMAYNHLKNITEAQVADVVFNDNDNLDVEAATAGDQIALGLGVAVAKGGETNVAVALSGSAGVFENQTRASVIDSVILQRANAPGSIAVNAYDRSRALLGGGSFAVSTDKGGSGGGSVVVGVLANQLEAEWLGSSATDFASLDVAANSASRLLAGALGVAVSTGAQSGSGAGSLFVVLMNNQVKATVDQTVNSASRLTGGTVNVAAASVPGLSALDGVFNHDAEAASTLDESGLDMDGSSTTAQINVEAQTSDGLFEKDGLDTTAQEGSTTADTSTHNLFDNGSIAGEAILGIAGSLGATGGKAAVGGAFGVIYSGSEYAASVKNTDIQLTGDLSIAARNETDVLAAAIGAAGAQNVSVSGSATALIGRGKVTADLDMTGRTLVANDLTVEALKTGGFYSLAGSVSGSSSAVAVGGAVSINDMQQSAAANINGGVYELTGDAVLNAAQQSRIITAALSGAVSGSGTGVGAAMTYNRIADTTTALLSSASMDAHNLTVAASQPNLGASIWSLAFNLAAGGGTAGVGAGVAVNLIDAERSAKIAGSTVNLTGDAAMNSALDGEIWSIGIDAAGGGTAGVGGSFAANNINGKDEVVVEDSTLTAAGSGNALALDASAGNGIKIASLAGSVTGGGTAAVGLAASVNRIAADRTALISGSTVSGFSTVDLKSGLEQAIYSIAVAGGGAGTVAVNGATTTNILDGTERAAIIDSTLNVGGLSLSAAEGKRTIWGLGAVVNGAGTAAVGAANVNNIILAKRIAEINDATLNMTGALSVASGGDALIRSAALGGGGAGTAAVGASVAVNVVSGEESATLNDVTVDGASSVVVEVTRGEVDIKTLAGNVQGAGTGAGAGAVAVSTVTQARKASITDSVLSLSANAPARVEALTRARIDTLALSGAGAGTGAAVFSNTSNNIDAKTYAQVVRSRGAAGNLQIKARDASSINSFAGGVAGAGTAAVGVASAVNRIANDIQASLSGSRDSAGWAVNDLLVDSRSDAQIHAASVSAGFSGTAAVSAGVATNLLQTSSKSLIDGGALVVARNNIGVLAFNRDVIRSAASVVSGSGNAAVSGLLTVNLIESETEAGIAGSATRIDALGLGAGLNVDNGTLQNAPDASVWADAEQFNPVLDLKTNEENVRGLAVRASSLQQLGQLSVSAAVSLVPLYSAAVSGLTNTSVVSGSTSAYIDDAQINQTNGNADASATQQVSVGAFSHTYSFGGVFSGALSLGAAAVAASIDTGVVSRETTARLHNVTLESKGETAVRAGSTQAASNIVTTAAGGIVGVAGSGGVLIVKGTTRALVNGGSDLDVGSLKVAASAVNRLSPNVGTVAGGAVGAGAGLGFGYNQSLVRAWIGDQNGGVTRTRVHSAGSTLINADSQTGILANALSASGGGVAVAGATNIILLENVTEAGASQMDFGSSTRRSGSLTILAKDRVDALLNGGSVAVGSASLGGSANVLVANNATRALLTDSTAWLSGGLTTDAQREIDARLNTITGGVGTTGFALGGSIGLLLLGSGAVEQDGRNPMDELDSDGAGTLSMADQFGSRNNATVEYQAVDIAADGSTTLRSESTSNETARLDDKTQFVSVKSRIDVTSYKHETVSRISNSTLNALGSVNVLASDKLRTSNLAGAAQGSGGVAAGGAVAFTLSNSRVTADILGGRLDAASLLLSAGAGALDASQPAVSVETYTGAAGLGAGLGAAVSVAVMNNHISSTLGGIQNYSGNLVARASDDLGVEATGMGAAVGAVAAGIVVATAVRDSEVSLTVADGTQLGAEHIDLSAKGLGHSNADATGASGGLLAAGTAVVAVATDSTSVSNKSGDNVIFKARSGGLSMAASALPEIHARAIGATLGGTLGVGASVATAVANNRVEALLGNSNDVQGNGGLLLSATLDTPRSASGASDLDPDQANVSAVAVAGSGGLYFSANGTVATASNTSEVMARTGADLKLPGGRVEIAADSVTQQYADALGIAVGGLAVGASVATASSDTTTAASLGDRAKNGTGSSAITDLILLATGQDINQAKSVAGSGGLVAGNASLAKTDTQGNVSVAVGKQVQVAAGNMALTSAYQALYGSHANSINAALAGASGAAANHKVSGSSSVQIGDSSELVAGHTLSINASNNFFSRHLGSAASGAGGGVISGQAVFNRTTITGDAIVQVGEQARLVAGVVAVDDPGKLILRAFSRHEVDEDVTLSTGGAVAGGGVENIHTATLNNTVDIGSGAELTSFGELGLGTYTISAAAIEALASTWGAAGVAVAKADATVTTNQSVKVASNANLEALGNISLQAGLDPEGLWQTRMLVDSSAQSVVRGIIAIPDADADAHIHNNSQVLVESGAQVLAARDIRIGGYTGQNEAKADGTARGYQLGFIPITSGDSTADVNRDSFVRLDGNFLAGRYNELVINIGADGSLVQSAGLPVIAGYNANFVPTAFLDSYTGIDPITNQILRSTLSSSITGAWELQSMMAAGGNITVQADRLAGSGVLTANGGPKIEIRNQSSRYLLLGDALIPDQPGGRVLFTGGASKLQFGAGSINEVNADRRAQILIDNSFAGSSGNVSYGPAIFLTGDLYNLGGLIHISNAKGSLGQFGTTMGQQVLVEVPEGSMSVFQPNDYWSVGGNPISEWKSFAGITGTANTAIQLIANYVYGSGALANNNGGLLYRGGSGGYSGQSDVLFGGCLPGSLGAGSNCSGSTANSFTGYSVRFHGMDNTESAIPVIPILALQKHAWNYESANLAGSAASKRIVGGQVGIQAKYIDINGTISSGLVTNRTLTVSAAMDSWIAQHYCASHICVGEVDIPSGLLQASTGSTVIGAKYDFSSKRIIVDDVNASGGGFVYLKGGIISTNPLGRIEVNNGYGQVTVNNLSAANLQLGNIDTGAGSVGIVQIVDTLKARINGQDATTWYVHTQGDGLSVFDNANGGSSIATARLVSQSNANTAQYNPKSGIRYEWSQRATLKRQVDRGENSFYVSDWVWNYPSTNNPWITYDGNVVDGNGNASVYQQDISGSLGSWRSQGVAYHGCDGGMGSNCNWNFKASAQHADGEWYAGWLYRFAQSATLDIKQSVKADNPFQIAFIGNASGVIDASTTNNLYLGGKISNPGGITSLKAGGDIESMAGSSLFSRDLNITAGRSVGSNGLPFTASLAEGGSLSVKSGAQGINLKLGSGANLKEINAGNGSGDVVIDAIGSLLANPTTAVHVRGRNIDLVSHTGSLGESGNALRMEAREVLTGNGGVTHGVVNASANRDIFVNEIQGDMWVGEVASETGDVWIKIDNGSLFDANRRLASQTLDDAQRQQVWEKLSLTTAYGAEGNIRTSSIQPFEDQVTANYREYWSLMQLGTQQDGMLHLDSDALELYRPLVEVKLGQSGLSDADILGFVRNRQSELENSFDESIGNGWQAQAAFSAYDADFTYVASATQIEALGRDAVWTEGELLYAIDQAALEPASGSSVGSADPNIRGRKVNLQVSGSVGQLADKLQIDFDKLRSGELGFEEAAALAVANAPGDVTLNYDAQGKISSLSVNRTLPFYVAASEQFDAIVGASAYLQSAGDLKIGTVTVGQDARLAAAENILAANGTSGAFSIGGNLTLLAGTGSIGTRETGAGILNLDVGGTLLAASAGKDIALRWTSGDFRIGRVFAVGDIHLDAPDGSLLQQFDGVSINGRNINLKASNDLGSSARALNVELESASSGLLNGVAGRDIWLSSDKNLHVGNLEAGSSLRLTAMTDLNADSLSAMAGKLLASAGGNATFGQVEATDNMQLSALGNLLVTDSAKASQLHLASGSELKLGDVSSLVADNLELRGQSIALGDQVAVSSTDTLLSSAGLIRVGEQAQLNASGLMSIQGGDLHLGAETVLAAGSMLLDVEDAVMSANSKLLSASNLDLHSANLTMGTGSQMSAGSAMDLYASGNMSLGHLTNTAESGVLFDLHADGHILSNGDGQTNLLASHGGESYILAGTGIGNATSALVVDMPELTSAIATSGDLYLTSRSALAGEAIAAQAGDVNFVSGTGLVDFSSISADGDLSYAGGSLTADSLNARTGNMVLNSSGYLDIGQLHAGSLLEVTGAGPTRIDNAMVGANADFDVAGTLTLGQLISAGDLTAIVNETLNAGSLTVGGKWSLQAVDAVVNTAGVAGTVGLDLSGDLQLASLTAGDDTRLDLGTGSALGTLDITGALDLQVDGLLTMQQATVSEQAVLRHLGIAGTALHHGALQIGQTLEVSGRGNWSGTDVTVIGNAAYDVGSAILDSLVTTGGTLLLKAANGFAAQELHSRKQWVNLVSGSANLGNASAFETLTVETNGDLTLFTGRSGGDMLLTTVAGSLGTIRFGQLANPDAEDVLVPAHLKSNRNLLVRTDGDVFGGNAEAELQLHIEGRNLFFGRAQSLQEDVSLLGSGDYADGHGDITGLLVEAKRDVGIIAGGDLSMPEVKFGGTYSLKAGRDLTVGVRGDLNVRGQAEAGRDLFFAIGGNVDLEGIKAGRNVLVEAGGAIALEKNVEGGGNIVLQARGGDITVGGSVSSSGVYVDPESGARSDVAGNVTLVATGNVTASSLSTASSVNGDIRVDGHSLDLGSVIASNDTDLLAGGFIKVGSSVSGGYQNWKAEESISFGQVLAGDQVVLGSLLDTRGGNIQAGRSVFVESGGAIALEKNVEGGGNIVLQARGGDITVGGAVSSSGVDVDTESGVRSDVIGNVTLVATGNVTASSLSTASSVNGDIRVDGHSLDLGNVTASNDTDLLAGGFIKVGSSVSGGYQNWKAEEFISFGQVLAGDQVVLGSLLDTRGGNIQAGRNVLVEAGGAIALEKNVEGGGDILLQARGGDITVGGSVSSSGVDVDPESGVRSDVIGNVTLVATGNITASNLSTASSVNGDIRVDGHSLDLGRITASNDTDLLAGGFIKVGSSESGGYQNWKAEESIGFDQLLAGGQALLDSLLDTRGGQIKAAEGIIAHAGWRNGVASPAALAFEQADAPTMSLWSGRLIRVDDASIGRSADLHAQLIELYGRHSGQGILNLTFGGLNNLSAPGDSLTTRLGATHIVTDSLDMLRTEFDTTALRVDFPDITNARYLSLTTPQARVVADNLSPEFRSEANVQLYEMDQAFWMYQNGFETYTDAYVLHRTFTHQTRVPNFAQGHENGSVDYQAITSADYSEMLLAPQNVQLRLGQLMNQVGGYVRPGVIGLGAQTNTVPLNMNWPESFGSSKEEDRSWEI
ncbi:MAG TPA: leukotoxin LktA family filamentous adhesin [Pseudomonas xinjiangensis]|uniref:Leukotoxin LktA family filamentous adhesin n=1 Tax=Halopseudomonas xinjiangensis TaxID=487184 RepID=A0A7V1BQU0_9GAMM|nr:leukotoxin LktA family filamentous adhesin [Halopseudomonas xinjiangensis]